MLISFLLSRRILLFFFLELARRPNEEQHAAGNAERKQDAHASPEQVNQFFEHFFPPLFFAVKTISFTPSLFISSVV